MSQPLDAMFPPPESDESAPLFFLKAAGQFSATRTADLPEAWEDPTNYYWILTTAGSVYHKAPNHSHYLTPGSVFVSKESPSRHLSFDTKVNSSWSGCYLSFGNAFSKDRLEYVMSQYGSFSKMSMTSLCVRLARNLTILKYPDRWTKARLAFQWFHAWWKDTEENHGRIVRLLESRENAAEFAQENLSLKALAAQLGYSPSYLSGFLHKRWAEKPSNLLRRRRLEGATKKLMASDIKIEALANELGYQSPSSFIRAFREAHGMSPARYRASHRHER